MDIIHQQGLSAIAKKVVRQQGLGALAKKVVSYLQVEVPNQPGFNLSLSNIPVTTRTNLGPLVDGIKIWQKFTANDNNLCAISLLVATYRKEIHSLAKFSLWDTDKAKMLRQVQIDTSVFVDNTWQRFSFEPVNYSNGLVFWLCFETNGAMDAVTLWTNNTIQGISIKNDQVLGQAICFKSHYREKIARLLDPLLFRKTLIGPLESPDKEQELTRIISYCIHTKDLFFLRLAHLADGFGRTEKVEKVLSVGRGMGFQEAFLAGRLPNIKLYATDIEATWNKYPLSNLSFAVKDILSWSEEADYDFVFSIETLEYIKDFRTAFKNMAVKVKPGKYLYISVPFASKDEQQDEALKKQEWNAFGHVVPGFTFEDLRDLFLENGFQIVQASNMFDNYLVNNINQLLSKIGYDEIENILNEIGHLFLVDVIERKVASRDEALGIRMLGQKNS